jgi:hypothetical protein
MTTNQLQAEIANNEILTEDECKFLEDHDIDTLLDYEHAERIAKITPDSIKHDKIIRKSVDILSTAKEELYKQASAATERTVQVAIYAAIDTVDAQIKTIYAMLS